MKGEENKYPLLLFVTRAPTACANASALTVQLTWLVQLPSAAIEMNVRSEIALHPGARPHVPTRLLRTATRHPATEVPWLSNELTGSPLPGPSVVKSEPGNMLCARSGCVLSTPVSMIAMITFASPCVRTHASGASRSTSGT